MSDKSNSQGLNQQVIKMMAFDAGLAVLENFSGTASPAFIQANTTRELIAFTIRQSAFGRQESVAEAES